MLTLVILILFASFSLGCSLEEIRLVSEGGVEYRRNNFDKSERERYSVQEKIDFKWEDGVNTAVTYRRRDVSDGPSGDHDDGVWFEVGFPIWKQSKPKNPMIARIEALEHRIAQLESQLEDNNEISARMPTTP